MSEHNSEHYVVISSDTHCGADLHDYKPYLEKKYHEEFDAWAETFSDPWRDIDARSGDDYRMGVASFLSDVNWDSPKRQARLEEQGISGEILFPNTVPPFFPSGMVSAPAPGYPAADTREYERRFAGLRAHNRWLADFCRALPGRRAGVAQIFLTDVEDTVAEVKRAREDGLVGVLLPPDHFCQLQNIYYPRYEPLWSALEDLDMSLGRHGVIAGEASSPETGYSAAVGLLESTHFSRRALTALIIGGVLERHPRLKFILTETGSAWVPPYLGELDAVMMDAAIPGTLTSMVAADAAAEMKKKPSQYFAEQCYLGSFLSQADIATRHQVGVDRIMWGSDFPHHEGTSPITSKALRHNFAGIPEDETRAMLAGTAAQVYGLDLAYLQAVADKIGPTVDDLNVPLADDEIPEYPKDSVCPTFMGNFIFDERTTA